MTTPSIYSRLSDKELLELAEYQKQLFLQDMAKQGHFKQFIDIPSAPTLNSPVTILPSDYDGAGPGFFSASLLGASSDGILSGNFSVACALRNWFGTAGTHKRLVNAVGTVIGSGSSNHGFQSADNLTNYLDIYGLNPLNPMLVRSGPGQMGLQLSHKAGGANYIVRNVVIDSPGATGITFNFGINGTAYYENLDVSHLRSFNNGQEGICYVGNTGSSYNGTNYINNATFHDNFSYNSSREGTQFEHINNLNAYNNTVILSGQTGGAGQDGCQQLHDVNGVTIDSIYDGAPTPGTVFTHGLVIRNQYYRFTTLTALFIGRTDNSYFAGSPRLNGQPILYDNCIFHCSNAGTLSKLCQVAERFANIEFRNCIFSSNITALYDDIRVAGFTNSLIGSISTNGNTSASITAPTYQPNYNVYNNYLTHGLLDPVSAATYYNRRMGMRTPRPGY